MYHSNNKYKNKKTVCDGITFDSKKECTRWNELKLLERAGEISRLQRQVKFEVLPKQKGERAISYIADFVYLEKDGSQSVEDVKGMKTDVYIIKRKLMLHTHGIKIKEV